MPALRYRKPWMSACLTGTLFKEIFSENSQVLMGQGVKPENQHPVARLDEASLVKLLNGIFDTTSKE